MSSIASIEFEMREDNTIKDVMRKLQAFNNM